MRRRSIAAATAGLALGVVAAGCGAGSETVFPTQSPGLFMSRVVRERAVGQYGVAWDSLHPSHQLVASRQQYIRCELKTPFPGRLRSVRVLRVFDEPVVIAGQRDPVDSKAVKLRVSVKVPFSDRPVNVTTTAHVVPVEGRWTWLLTQSNFEIYRANRCPGTLPKGPAA